MRRIFFFKLTLVCAVMLLTLSFFCLADVVHLKSGKTIEGKIIEKTDEKIKIDYQGLEITFFQDDIDKIDKSSALPVENKEIKELLSYRVRKKFLLKPSVDLYSLQFKYPLVKKNIPGQSIKNLYTYPKFNALVDDPDGNEIAVFYFSDVKAGRPLEIEIRYIVQIEVAYIKLEPSLVPSDYSSVKEDLREYLKDEEGLNLSSPAITEIVDSFASGKETPYLKAKAMYDFITDNIEYENVETMSGFQSPEETLAMKRGNCAAISKLFVAFCRASGIPSRQIDGIVFEPNVSSKKSVNKVGHAWSEIYLPPYGWLPVDATFGISQKDKFYAFNYKIHIREYYGQIVSKELGSLYRGSSMQIRAKNRYGAFPVSRDAEIIIELLDGE